jgi:type II secretory pathway component PulM
MTSEVETLELAHQLDTISKTVKGWIAFDRQQRERDGLPTEASTHLLAPDFWPTHGSLQEWTQTLDQAGARMATAQKAQAEARALRQTMLTIAQSAGNELAQAVVDSYTRQGIDLLAERRVTPPITAPSSPLPASSR